jgi:uncharacterized delta-60 repeat protein
MRVARIARYLAASICLLCAISVQGFASGDVDASFNAGLVNSRVLGAVTQPDNKIVIVGAFNAVGYPVGGSYSFNRWAVARLNSDGSLDSSFNPGHALDQNAYAVALQSDGKIIVGGWFTLYNTSVVNHIVRLNADGSMDSSFNTGSGADNDVNAISVQPDGKVLVVGSFSTFNGVSRNRIARLNADGSLDNSFNPGSGANNSVSAIALQIDGKVLIGGYFSAYNGVSRNFIARLNVDGSLDMTFNPSSTIQYGRVQSILVQPDAKILFGSYVQYPSSSCIERLNAVGSLDNGFAIGACGGTGSFDTRLFLQADGRVLLIGDFVSYNGIARNCILRLDSDGSLDAGFDPGSTDNMKWTTAITMQSDGKILVSGKYTIGQSTDNLILRMHTGDNDADGFEDAADAFPNNPAEWLDTDHDGIGNNADLDDDGDGVPDYIDADPLNLVIHTERTLLLNTVFKGSSISEHGLQQ